MGDEKKVLDVAACISVHSALTTSEIFFSILNSLSMSVYVCMHFQKQISFSLRSAQNFEIIQKTLRSFIL